MEASTLVIKVKYGDCLRRFNASVTDDKLGLSMGKLMEKICILFNLPTDTELTLTYIDEDGETVTLIDDEDLRDVVKQGLDPLRITVTMNEEKKSSSSTPLSSPPVQQQFQNINSFVSEILKPIPDPLHERLAKLLTDLVPNSSSSAAGITPGTAAIIEYFSNMGLGYLSQSLELQARVRPSSQNDVPERRETVTETKDSGLSKVDPTTPLKSQSQGGYEKQLPPNNENSPKFKSVATMVDPTPLKAQSQGGSEKPLHSPKLKSEATMKIQDVKASTPEGSMEASSSKAPGISDVARSIDGINKNHCDSEPILPKSRLVPDNVGEKVNKAIGPHLGPNPAFVGAHDCMKGWTPCDPGNSPHIVPHSGGFSSCTQPLADPPATYPYHWPSTGLHDFYARWLYSLNSQVPRGMEVNLGVSKLDSCFIADVTMSDGTIITPSTTFTKIWRMRNNGTLAWPENTRLVWDGGNKLSNSCSVELQIPAAGLAVNQEFDVAVDFISPELPGRCISYWRMAAPSGLTFGQCVWVHIQVQATTEEAQHGVRGLNLNLPPVNNALTGPKVNNAVMDPLVKDSRPEEVSEPITPLPNIEQDMEFPIPDSSMIGSGATNLAPTSPSWTLNPVGDRSDMASAVYPPPYMHYPAPPPQLTFYPTQPFLYSQPAPAVFYPIQPPEPSLLYPPPPNFYSPPPPTPPTISPPHPVSLHDYTSPSPPPSYSRLSPAGDTLENSEGVQGIEELEEKLLWELEALGFSEVELNREILRFHEYDFQQTLIDLCGGNTL
ncbi:protein JOKA2-like [Henckelia pumila]|uniref:protein JOKA2-like n=1 Tax=Henckelia pumila TaxID=405737 RepID=UPI003C6DD578